mgnify:FL=1
MFTKIDGIEGLADAAKNILEGRADIYELVASLSKEGAADFMGAAAKAKEAGKDEFEFGGKTYPVKLSKDVADKISKAMGEEKEEDIQELAGKPADEVTYHSSVGVGEKMPSPTKHEEADEDEIDETDVEDEAGEVEYKNELEVTEGFTDEEVRALCHSKDHDCATIIEHPEFGLGKPVHGSHAIPDDNGFVEWYDVEFKHGIEKKIYAENVKIIASEDHMKDDDEDPSDEDSKNEGTVLEGKMKELHGYIEAGMTADEIIKAMKLKKTPDMKKFIQGLMKK